MLAADALGGQLEESSPLRCVWCAYVCTESSHCIYCYMRYAHLIYYSQDPQLSINILNTPAIL